MWKHFDKLVKKLIEKLIDCRVVLEITETGLRFIGIGPIGVVGVIVILIFLALLAGDFARLFGS